MLFSENVANGRVVLLSHNGCLVIKFACEWKIDFMYEISRVFLQTILLEFIFFRFPSIYSVLAYRKKVLHGRTC